jgi:hypothetical protein
MEPSRLRVTQFSLLRTLATEGPARMSDLAKTLLLDRTCASHPSIRWSSGVAITAKPRRAHAVSLTHTGDVPWRRDTAAGAVAGRRRIGPISTALIATLTEVEQLHPDPGGVARLK